MVLSNFKGIADEILLKSFSEHIEDSACWSPEQSSFIAERPFATSTLVLEQWLQPVSLLTESTLRN